MNSNFVTPVPSRRISSKARLELRIASQNAVTIKIEAAFSKQKTDLGCFTIQSNLELNKVYPDTKNIYGHFQLRIIFLSSDDNVLDIQEIPYEIVKSDVHSTRLLDGCWTSIYHWSEDEARYFNKGLKTMTDEDWKQHIYSMHKIGVTCVLIQNMFDSRWHVNQHSLTADTFDGKAFYPSKLFPDRAELTANDPIEAIFAAADECDMTVFPGVGLYAWFDFSPESLKWHKRVTIELLERYGHHKSLYGWYVSEEIMGALYHGYDPVPDENYRDIVHFFEDYSYFIQKLTPTKPVALAPNNFDFHLHAAEWSEILPFVDILIPFGFARGKNNIQEIAELCSQYGTHFWVDMEIFDFPFDNGLKPKSYEKLIEEIHNYDMLEQIYGYQYTGLINEPGFRMSLGEEDTEQLYTKYYQYYSSIHKAT